MNNIEKGSRPVGGTRKEAYDASFRISHPCAVPCVTLRGLIRLRISRYRGWRCLGLTATNWQKSFSESYQFQDWKYTLTFRMDFLVSYKRILLQVLSPSLWQAFCCASKIFFFFCHSPKIKRGCIPQHQGFLMAAMATEIQSFLVCIAKRSNLQSSSPSQTKYPSERNLPFSRKSVKEFIH